MALFHKLLKNKNNPELYDPQKHRKLIEECFENPEVVFKAIDKYTGTLKPGVVFVKQKKVEDIAHFLNAQNADEFKMDFDIIARDARNKVMKLVQANRSTQYLRSDDVMYLTSMINLGRSGTDALATLTTRAKKQAEEAEAAAIKKVEEARVKDEQKRVKEAVDEENRKNREQKKQEIADAKKQKENETMVESFNKEYLHTERWDKDVEKITKASGESTASHKLIEETDLPLLDSKMKDFRERRDSGVDFDAPVQRAFLAEIDSKIVEVRRKIALLGKTDAKINNTYTALEADLDSAEAAAEAIQVDDPRHEAAQALLKKVQEVREKLAATDFVFKSRRTVNETSSKIVQSAAEEIGLSR